MLGTLKQQVVVVKLEVFVSCTSSPNLCTLMWQKKQKTFPLQVFGN
jgi:hypothetical protein